MRFLVLGYATCAAFRSDFQPAEQLRSVQYALHPSLMDISIPAAQVKGQAYPGSQAPFAPPPRMKKNTAEIRDSPTSGARQQAAMGVPEALVAWASRFKDFSVAVRQVRKV